jgi:cytochrome c oxidase assembly protein subunit 15
MPAITTLIRRWLLAVWALVLVMVVVGGVTRLTGSGLSIVHWKPISGIVPPLSEADWAREFASYQSSPQFREVNAAISLEGFKRIFFWEYVHRLLGRLIGLAVALPFAWLWLKRALTRKLAQQVAGLFLLGALQGALGWYMVASGLVDEPRVSHYRLAAHLLLAFVTGALTLWIALGVGEERGALARVPGAGLALGLLGLSLVQCVWGGFMAGTHAGYYVSSFPDMNGGYAPGPFFTGPSAWADALSSPLAIQWLHRALGFAVLALAISVAVFVRRAHASVAVRRAGVLVGAVAFAQLNLGAITVLSRIALPWAVLHQAFAYLLVSAVVVLADRLACSGANRPHGAGHP